MVQGLGIYVWQVSEALHRILPPQRPPAPSILPAVQDDGNRSLKLLPARGILTAPSLQHDHDLVIRFFDRMGCSPSILVRYWLRRREPVLGLPVIPDVQDLPACRYLKVPPRFVSDRREIRTSEFPILPDRLCPADQQCS